jgi:hypothetical protein
MTWPVIVLDGPYRNQTLSGIQYDNHGDVTGQEIFVCNDWCEGFTWAKKNNHAYALFVKSGTMFTDWKQWKQLVDTYPHTGLIAHLIWHPDKKLQLNDQCWFMAVDNYTLDDFSVKTVCHPMPLRSEQNLHDNYTPLWVKPGKEITQYQVDGFGQGIIAKQLQRNRGIVNWNRASRDLKFFLYNGKIDLTKYQDYKNIAENQLWVFNNEPVIVTNQPRLVTPGSGLSWMLNIVNDSTEEIQIVDISRTQVNFCHQLWTKWNGIDYGTFVWNFISQNKLVHYQLDDPRLTPLQKLTLKKRSTFVDYVNDKFTTLAGKNFIDRWQNAQQTKQVKFFNGSLINWVINNDVSNYDNIWCSNILNYKWTLLHNTVEEYNIFQSKIK